MPITYIETTGGGVLSGTQQPLLQVRTNLPDAFGGNVTFAGRISPVQASGGGLSPSIVLSGSPIALPGVPGGGLSLNWVLQVNLTTGVVTKKTGASATTGTQATPTADAGNLVFFTHTITNGDTVPWLRAPTLIDLCE